MMQYEYIRQVPNPTMKAVKQLQPGQHHVITEWDLNTPPGNFIRQSMRGKGWKVSVRRLKDGAGWVVWRVS